MAEDIKGSVSQFIADHEDTIAIVGYTALYVAASLVICYWGTKLSIKGMIAACAAAV